MASDVYVRVKKIGIARAVGEEFFPGGEKEILERVVILEFKVEEIVRRSRRLVARGTALPGELTRDSYSNLVEN